MRLDLFAWAEVEVGSWFSAPHQRIWLRCSLPMALWAEAEGYEVLVGHGTEWKVEVDYAVRLRVEGKGRAFVHEPASAAVHPVPTDEIFSNADLRPMGDGTMMAVKRALRMHDLQQKGVLAQIREETGKLKMLVGKAKAEKAAAVAADEADEAAEVVPEVEL
ncbi:MAG: hypothetical protein [Microviridae sp.]|nr:MAG: hypothetical protein [Microviridae sp.]